MARFAKLMSSNTYIDRSTAENELGATSDDIEASIGDSVRLSVSVLEGKANAIGMKGE